MTAFERFIQLHFVAFIENCRMLDKFDSGELPMRPVQYRRVGAAARKALLALMAAADQDVIGAILRVAAKSNAAHELFEAEWLTELLRDAPFLLAELTQVLERASGGTVKAAPAITILCRQAENGDYLRIAGVESLDDGSRRILEVLMRDVSEPTVTPDGFELQAPAGNASQLATMLASVLSTRDVTVRVA